MVAAALLAAATTWMPVAFLFVYGPLGFALWSLGAIAALVVYLRVVPRTWVAVATAEVLDVGALFATFILLLLAGCGSASGHVDYWMWALGGVIAFAIGTWALLNPSRAMWGLPLGTLAAAGVVIGLAVALNGNTGLCPD